MYRMIGGKGHHRGVTNCIITSRPNAPRGPARAPHTRHPSGRPMPTLLTSLLEAAERKSRSGSSARRAVDGLLKQHAAADGRLDLAALCRFVETLMPGCRPREVLALFNAHAQASAGTKDDTMAVPARSLADAILRAGGGGEAWPVAGSNAPRAAVPAPVSRDCGDVGREEGAASPPAVAQKRPPPKSSQPPASAPPPQPPSAPPPHPSAPPPAAAVPPPAPTPQAPPPLSEGHFAEVLRQLRQVLDARAAAAEADLPRRERLDLDDEFISLR